MHEQPTKRRKLGRGGRRTQYVHIATLARSNLTLPEAELAYQAFSQQIGINAVGQGKEYFSNSIS
jgi:hypothetical protein